MKNKKLSTFIVCLVGLIMVFIVFMFAVNNQKSHSSDTNDTEYIPYDELTNLQLKVIELFNNMYPQDYEFEFDNQNEYQVTIADLAKKGMNENIFNKGVSCDLNASFIKVYYENDEQIRSVYTSCTKR